MSECVCVPGFGGTGTVIGVPEGKSVGPGDEGLGVKEVPVVGQ